jgi:hypothetical protein
MVNYGKREKNPYPSYPNPPPNKSPVGYTGLGIFKPMMRIELTTP